MVPFAEIAEKAENADFGEIDEKKLYTYENKKSLLT